MEILQLKESGLEYLPAFLTSLAIGLLIGLERERNPTAKAGLRTFSVVALLGTMAGMLSDLTASPWMLPIGFMAIALLIVAAYFGNTSTEEDPGTTTEAALLMCFGLGAMIWFGYDTLAVILGILLTILLYFKPELRGMTQRLSRRDLFSVLQFAVLSFVILPVLPNHGYGPYDALNPHHIWLMVVLVSGVNLAGYVALRLVGQRYGAPLLGFLGGIVSSTATTLIYARHGRKYEGMRQLAVMVILLANLVLLIRLTFLAVVVAPGVMSKLLPILGVALLLGTLVAGICWRQFHRSGELPMPEIKNPTEIKTSLTFGFIYAVVLFLSALLSDKIGSVGLYGVALISGMTDVDAITLSSLQLFTQGKILSSQVVTAIVLALNANLLFKFGMVFVVGGTGMARQCFSGFVAVGLGASMMLYLW